MRRVSCMIQFTSCTSNCWGQIKAQWSQSIASTPQRTAAITPTHGRRWVPSTQLCNRLLHALFFLFLKYLVVCVCWPAGFACVFWLWTWGEICPLPAPAEEHVFEWLLQHHVYWQFSGCQTNQNKSLTTLSFPNTFVNLTSMRCTNLLQMSIWLKTKAKIKCICLHMVFQIKIT